MINLGFVKSKNDFCLYKKVSQENYLHILLYVNNIVFFDNDELEVDTFKQALSNTFKMKNLRYSKNILGITEYWDWYYCNKSRKLFKLLI